jgi:hypothetical protein
MAVTFHPISRCSDLLRGETTMQTDDENREVAELATGRISPDWDRIIR